MQGRGRLQALAALRGRTRRLGVPRQPARDRSLPAVAGCARVREGQRRSAYRDCHLGGRYPARQRCPVPGPRIAVPRHSACRRRQHPAGGWIVRAQRAGLLLFNYLEGAKHGEEKSEKRRKEKEEEESIRKKEESIKKSG